ncbi:MAG: hypothetical protein D6689_05985 [Deltaproteobacteria bacterium]|nr:MAG: hypothetical protein D6689_05985 [Deltaproteobacteria bacterium]
MGRGEAIGAHIGIDLGTTHSCVAVVRDGRAVVVAGPHGDRTTPSILARTDDGAWIVGHAARRQAVTNPQHTLFGLKRLIGRRFDDPEVVQLARTAPYRIVRGDLGEAWVRVGGVALSPQEITANLVRHLCDTASAALGAPIASAVITVPAYFDDAQRKATRDAAERAGVPVAALLNEPTAAALAYAVSRGAGRATIAVFDFGGGTFDITILRADGDVYEVAATCGDTFCGGDDIDRAVVDEWVRRIAADHGIDPSADPMALQRLREAAESAKRDLSAADAVDVAVPFIGETAAGPVHFETRLARADLEALAAPVLDRLEAPCRRAVADAGVAPGDIDCVVLAGGSTRMPAVQRRVADWFDASIARDVHPDEVVALGAALHADALATGGARVLVDVTPHALGVEVDDGAMSVVVPRNSSLPASATRRYKTLRDGQTFVDIRVYQGDAEAVADNRYLGRFRLGGLPPRPAGDAQVDVTFAVDVDGLVRVTATDVVRGRAASVEFSSDVLDEAAREMSREQNARAAHVPAEPTAPEPAVSPPPASAGASAAPATPSDAEPAGGDRGPRDAVVDSPGPAVPANPVPGRTSPSGRATASRRRARRTTLGRSYLSERSTAVRLDPASRSASGRTAVRRRPTAAPPADEPPPDPVRADYEAAAKADLFARLGLHWTDPPTRLGPAIADLRRRYGPGSDAARRSPDFAARRLALAEEAYTRLSTLAGRRAYRVDELGVDVRAAAELLEQQARLDLRRQDVADAIDKLRAAQDLFPSAARKAMVDELVRQAHALGIKLGHD